MKTHRIVRFAVAAIVASLGVAVAQPASAGYVASSGAIGYVGLPAAKCYYKDAWNRLDVEVPAPALYAPNVSTGWGNDAAWARYQVHVMDSAGRGFSTGFSGWSLSYDNRPATFTGAAAYLTGIPDRSKVWITVEWSGANNYRSSGVYVVDTYFLYVGGSGPFGGMDSCAKWKP